MRAAQSGRPQSLHPASRRVQPRRCEVGRGGCGRCRRVRTVSHDLSLKCDGIDRDTSLRSAISSNRSRCPKALVTRNDHEFNPWRELWDLHEAVVRTLREKMAEKRATLDERLLRIGVSVHLPANSSSQVSEPG